MRPEYDFTGGVRGKHYKVLREQGYIVRVHNDDGTVSERHVAGSTLQVTAQVRVVDVQFVGDVLRVSLSDKRDISVHIKHVSWLKWLLKATPGQRANWSIEPRGSAIYWDDLDDGFEICHLLGMQPVD